MSYDPLDALLGGGEEEERPASPAAQQGGFQLCPARFSFPPRAEDHLLSMIRYWREHPDTELECRFLEEATLASHTQGTLSVKSFELLGSLLRQEGSPFQKTQCVCVDFAPLSHTQRMRATKHAGEGRTYRFERKETLATLDFLPRGFPGLRLRLSLQRERAFPPGEFPPLSHLKPDLVRYKSRASFPLGGWASMDLTRRWQHRVHPPVQDWTDLPHHLKQLREKINECNVSIHEALRKALQGNSALEAEVEFQREDFSGGEEDEQVRDTIASVLFFFLALGESGCGSGCNGVGCIEGEQVRLKGGACWLCE